MRTLALGLLAFASLPALAPVRSGDIEGTGSRGR
jgi:hypothetical protein